MITDFIYLNVYFHPGSGGSRGGARGAPAPAEIWLAPEVPLSCHSLGIYVSVKSFEIQPVQRKLYM